MSIIDKRFKCHMCGHETYHDREECVKCETIGRVMPIPKPVYRCYLNGSIYGCGNLEYMNELFKDYVVTMEMYGKKKVEFEIVKD